MRPLHPPARLRRFLMRSAGHRSYPAVVALIAFFATLTFSLPFALLLIPAVLLAPRRWLLLGLASGIASGCGAAALEQVFHHLGWQYVIAHYPELVRADFWRQAGDWLQHYGLVALFFIAASPLPQTPALLFCALVDQPAAGVLLAVGLGKSLKYGLLAWLTARYPGRFVRYA